MREGEAISAARFLTEVGSVTSQGKKIREPAQAFVLHFKGCRARPITSHPLEAKRRAVAFPRKPQPTMTTLLLLLGGTENRCQVAEKMRALPKMINDQKLLSLPKASCCNLSPCNLCWLVNVITLLCFCFFGIKLCFAFHTLRRCLKST